ncbi:MAG: type I methionyl aminopeptidase [Candidatus Pacebacteria bacterium]|nr:type I methionyl aminopeptidase [Candidatus Paceibacterota bacterium]
MIARTPTQVEGLREAGKRMRIVVDEVMALVRPGVGSMELEMKAREVTARVEAEPSYLGYKNQGEDAYPAALCVSVNNEIAHSPPKPEKILKAGDVVSVDFGLVYKGYFMDTAYTVAVGEVDAAAKNLIEGTREALPVAIDAARVGNTVGDIGAAVEKMAKKYKLGIVKDLRGHGVGNDVHEDPNVPNFGKAGKGEKLVEGMVLALEPIFAEGGGALIDGGDGFTYSTSDGSRAAHFEHTILITKDGPEILT